ncbi:hypothetical protein Pmani_020141 [Petrolisthes manimaculis]|uniref:Uncharacterized protein n=1 Tax=Petrolisthes manimaculis TaxID=1843537 RepID=A0AAE1PGX4_9EUCA|nr:hypothetical protein Pmani_020141 [Petrolisthes manimaculis]
MSDEESGEEGVGRKEGVEGGGEGGGGGRRRRRVWMRGRTEAKAVSSTSASPTASSTSASPTASSTSVLIVSRPKHCLHPSAALISVAVMSCI